MITSSNRGGAGQRAGSWRRALLSLLALAALVLLVVAVPIILALVGGVPFAHGDVNGVTGALTGHTVDGPRLISQWLSRGGLLLAWLAWAWMTVCVVVELWAWSRCQSPRGLPASRTLQALAACLVGTALAMSAAGRGSSAISPEGAFSTGGSTLSVDHSPSTPAIRVIDDASPFDPWAPLLDPVAAGPASNHSEGATSALSPPTPTSHRQTETVGASKGPGSEGSVASETRQTEEDRDWGGAIGSASSLVSTVRLSTANSASWPELPSVHLVKSRETLWSIATEKLGTALRWQEIAELNYGLKQADGRALTADHWIKPGWRLLLPPTPVGRPAWSATTRSDQALPLDATEVNRSLHDRSPYDEATAASVQLRTGEEHASVERHPTGTEPLAMETVWSPARLPVGLPLLPELPGLTGLNPSSPKDASAPTKQEETRRRSGPDHHRGGTVEPAGRMSPPFVPVGAGVVGAGVVRMIDRMRRAQQRHREEGRYIKLPDGPHADLEQRLRLGEYGSVVDEVDGALRILVPRMQRSGRGVPVVEGVRVRPDSIALILDEFDDGDGAETPPPRGPSSGSDLAARTLIVQREAVPPDRYRHRGGTRRRAPAPLLVSAGRGPDGVVLVNLEFLGSLAIEGDSAETEGFVRALALELATSYWSGQFDLVVVGFGSELERFDRVTEATDGQALIHQLCRRQLNGRERLRTTGYASFAQARWVEDADAWDPTIVVCSPDVPDALVDELLDCAADPRLGTVIVAAGSRSRTRHSVSLIGDGRSLGLGSLGSVVFPQRVDPDELHAVTALLDTAASHQAVLSSEEPYVNLPINLPNNLGTKSATSASTEWLRPLSSRTTGLASAPHGNDRAEVPEGVVEVLVLGPVEVRGAARPFTRAWSEELVVYLAMHPDGASNEAWATALWPDRLMAASSLYSTASVARRSLGQSPDGADHLPRSHGRLALAPTVTTDWAQFVTLADSEDITQWRLALALVRGRPFQGLRASDWPILEGIGPAIESAVVDLSGRLAGACLRTGDPRGAEWAARRGLLVSPYDERLYRMLMRAADLGGNPAGVEAVMSELVRLVADDIEPFDTVHSSTMDLYRSLTRRNPPSGGARHR